MNNLVKEVSPLSPTSPRDAVVGDVQVKHGALPESPWKGAALMSAAMFCAAAIDTSVKALAGSYATAEIVLLRTLFALPVALSIAHREGGFVEAFRTDLPLWHLYRGFLACGATFGFFYGLKFVPLVTAVLLAYVAPLLVVLLSYPLIGERVGLRRWIGVLVGFSGTVSIVASGGGGEVSEFMQHPAVFAIFGSATCWALILVSNRQLAGRERPATLAIYMMPISGLVALILTLAGDWVTPEGSDWGLFAIAGVGSACIHFLAAVASRYARAATLAPFEYSNLIWVAIASWLFWGEVPELLTIAGGLAILLGGFIAARGHN